MRLQRELARSADPQVQERLARHLAASFEVNDWLAKTYPDLNNPAPAAEAAQTGLRQKMAEIFPRMAEVAQVCEPLQARTHRGTGADSRCLPRTRMRHRAGQPRPAGVAVGHGACGPDAGEGIDDAGPQR
jgi:hypothetical protein